MKNILVPIDFSEVTKAILENASLLASRFAGKVWLLHVTIPHPDLKEGTEAVYPKPMRDEMAQIYHKEHEQIQGFAKELREKGIEANALLIQGNTVEMILKKEVELQADLIVMGSHGHGALYNILLGSVTEGILRSANCPLYIVPSKKSEHIA